ncbi:diguanylate cyclase [Colwellia sp. MB02u-6]|uniref:GGDEF domain-containing protein n=1 Tax=Colwellia sp. MB02u-6 TaxID=2759824 RepID=UPI002870A04D|nr:diguanylate cyclase [Colwellia sp. MB02u-6]
MLIVLDHFKKTNGIYGHFIGDKVLIHFTQTIQNFLRKSDLKGKRIATGSG